MARNDYECETCGKMERDWTDAVRPRCCGVEMFWMPAGGYVDALIPYEVDFGQGPVTITSIHQARAIERQSERDYRDGRGAPILFRTLSQNNSNLDTNAFGRTEPPKFSTRTRRGEPFVDRSKIFTRQG